MDAAERQAEEQMHLVVQQKTAALEEAARAKKALEALTTFPGLGMMGVAPASSSMPMAAGHTRRSPGAVKKTSPRRERGSSGSAGAGAGVGEAVDSAATKEQPPFGSGMVLDPDDPFPLNDDHGRHNGGQSPASSSHHTSEDGTLSSHVLAHNRAASGSAHRTRAGRKYAESSDEDSDSEDGKMWSQHAAQDDSEDDGNGVEWVGHSIAGAGAGASAGASAGGGSFGSARRKPGGDRGTSTSGGGVAVRTRVVRPVATRSTASSILRRMEGMLHELTQAAEASEGGR